MRQQSAADSASAAQFLRASTKCDSMLRTLCMLRIPRSFHADIQFLYFLLCDRWSAILFTDFLVHREQERSRVFHSFFLRFNMCSTDRLSPRLKLLEVRGNVKPDWAAGRLDLRDLVWKKSQGPLAVRERNGVIVCF